MISLVPLPFKARQMLEGKQSGRWQRVWVPRVTIVMLQTSAYTQTRYIHYKVQENKKIERRGGSTRESIPLLQAKLHRNCPDAAAQNVHTLLIYRRTKKKDKRKGSKGAKSRETVPLLQAS